MFEKGHKTINKPKARKTYTISALKFTGAYKTSAKSAPMSKGRNFYLKYIENYALLTPKQAIAAQCAHCSGWYVDGKLDCECHDCPLYPYMPYGLCRKVRVQGKEPGVSGDGESPAARNRIAE
jgi:hypothetical protein